MTFIVEAFKNQRYSLGWGVAKIAIVLFFFFSILLSAQAEPESWVKIAVLLRDENPEISEQAKRELGKDKALVEKVLGTLVSANRSDPLAKERALLVIQKMGGRFDSEKIRSGLVSALQIQPDDWEVLLILNAYLAPKESVPKESLKEKKLRKSISAIYIKHLVNEELGSAATLGYWDGLAILGETPDSKDFQALFQSKHDLAKYDLAKLDAVRFAGEAWLKGQVENSILQDALLLLPLNLKGEVLRILDRAPKTKLRPFLEAVQKLEPLLKSQKAKEMAQKIIAKIENERPI